MSDVPSSEGRTPEEQTNRREALVTGATSGIGRAICDDLLARGYRVLGIGRRAADPELARPDFRGVAIDLEDLEALPGRLQELVRSCGAVDAVVLAAGRGLLGGFEQASYEQIRSLIDLDLTSQVFVARALLPVLKRRGGGHLVFLGSEAALRGSRNGAVYCAVKFALRGLAQALRDECARGRVGVSIVNPGMVRTPFFEDLPIEPGSEPEEALRPVDVAAAVGYLLEQPPSLVVDEINLSPIRKKVHFKNRSP